MAGKPGAVKGLALWYYLTTVFSVTAGLTVTARLL
jgi:hypothetical protein